MSEIKKQFKKEVLATQTSTISGKVVTIEKIAFGDAGTLSIYLEIVNTQKMTKQSVYISSDILAEFGKFVSQNQI